MASVPAPRRRGRVEHWVADQGYGFIKPDGSDQRLFVHATSVRDGSSLAVGQRVSFKLRPNERRKYDDAVEVEVLADGALVRRSRTDLAAAEEITETTVTQTQTVLVPCSRLVVFVLDVSGSMAGARIDRALRGAQNIFDELLQRQHHFALYAFNNEVHLVCERKPKSRVDWREVRSAVLGLVGGQTALWQATKDALGMVKAMRRKPDLRVDLVVMTDGEDNKSKSVLPELREQIRHPGIANINVLFLACCEADTSAMKGMDDSARHVRLVVESDRTAEAVTKAFGRAHSFLRTSTVTVTDRTHATADGRVEAVRTTVRGTTVHEARSGGRVNATTTARALQGGGHHDRTAGTRSGHGGGSNKKGVLCRFHRNGNCRNGASCPYRHA